MKKDFFLFLLLVLLALFSGCKYDSPKHTIEASFVAINLGAPEGFDLYIRSLSKSGNRIFGSAQTLNTLHDELAGNEVKQMEPKLTQIYWDEKKQRHQSYAVEILIRSPKGVRFHHYSTVIVHCLDHQEGTGLSDDRVCGISNFDGPPDFTLWNGEKFED